MHFHAQALESHGSTTPDPLWRHGRCWFHWDHQRAYVEKEGRRILISSQDKTLGLEWYVFPGRFWPHIGLTLNPPEHDFAFAVEVGGVVAFHLYTEHVLPKRFRDWLYQRYSYHQRELHVGFTDGTLSWTLWLDDNEWHKDEPKWRHGWFNVADCLFGRTQHHESLCHGESRFIAFSAKELVEVRIKLYDEWWTRPRWPFILHHSHSAEVVPSHPVPIPGKGENAWDCRDDANFSTIMRHVTSADEAALRYQRDIEERRERYGGRNWQPTPAQPRKGPHAGHDHDSGTSRAGSARSGPAPTL